MISGSVNDKRIPTITLIIGGRKFVAVIDTAFNFDFELPLAVFPDVNARYKGRVLSDLAANQSIVEALYDITLEFDGKLVDTTATFVDSDEILIGTRLLQDHRLTVDFPSGTVTLKRTKLR